MKAALIHILLHMHRHSSFRHVFTLSLFQTQTTTHACTAGWTTQDSLAMPGKVCLQSSIVLVREESMWKTS